MKSSSAIKSDLLLLLASAIWGFAFVAQRASMQYIGPFTFNTIRFALGASMIAVIHRMKGKNIQSEEDKKEQINPQSRFGYQLKPGLFAGIILFAGAGFQQSGIVFTTAGKAGFITGLYVVIVPILGLFFHAKPSRANWAGAMLAITGLYLLSFRGTFNIEAGDSLVLAGALFWAIHVIVIGRYSRVIPPLLLALVQFTTCAVLSAIVAVAVETISARAIRSALIPILYSGFLSVGVAFTLQVFAQRKAHPTHAAIILSMETVFAAIGGWIILHETIPTRGLIGCTLMLSGILVSQIFHLKNLNKKTSPSQPV